MNRRIGRRSTSKRSDDGYLRYLKPGALAQLRDFKINARSHHRSSDSQVHLHRAVSTSPISSSGSPNAVAASQQQQREVTVATATDGVFPYFSRSFCGPRFPQRKKFMAAKSMFFLNTNPNSPTADGPQVVIDALNSDFLLAR